MKIKYIFILLFSIISTQNHIYSQYYKTMYSYKGSGSDASIYFWYDITIGFDNAITGPLTSDIVTGLNKGIFTNSIKSNAIINNTLSNVNRAVVAQQPGYITCSVNETPEADSYQTNIFYNVAAGFNQKTIKLSVNYDNMNTSVDFNNAVYNPLMMNTFPVTSTFPSSISKYLNATPYVESTNSSIKSAALSITSGCTDFRTAVIKLSQWIEANIKMIDNTPNKSLEVYDNKYGDCDGVAHLLAAFCRSLNIPARIVSGYTIEHPITYPANKSGTSTITLGSGNATILGGHTVCEIYVPFMNNWVRCDPAQRTTLFGNQSFIKIATGTESTNQLHYGYNPVYHYNQSIVPTANSFNLTKGVYIGSNSANYQFVKSDIFSGTAKTTDSPGILCAADPTITVGLYDKVTIQDPAAGTIGSSGLIPNNTYSMTPCSPANFYARFATETTPATYSTGFDWSIVLYRANGDEYIYAQQNGMLSNTYTPNDYGEGCFWQPNIGVLPAYDWLYDPSGNIYGKVKVVVHINDGDTKSDETTIGVSPYNNIQNTLYTTNTTINACATLNLTNVSISGTPTVTLNANGLGVIINGTFEAPIGSTLIINK